MRITRLTVFIAILVLFIACKSRKHGGQSSWVFDQEEVLTTEQEKSLDSLFKAHEKITTNQIALITTSTYAPDTNIVAFSTNTFNRWGIGRKDINNGVLIVFSGSNRETRIATGLGTEKVLTDEIAAEILKSKMIPQFKNGETFKGLWEGSKAIVEFLERPKNKITQAEKKDMPLEKFSDDHLFRVHSKETVKRWLSQLHYFYYIRAYGGHANDGDAFEAYFTYAGKQDLEKKLSQLGIPAGSGLGRKTLFGHNVVVSDYGGTLRLAIAGVRNDNPYEVSEADFQTCLSLEKKFEELGWDKNGYSGPIDNICCISKNRYPELYP